MVKHFNFSARDKKGERLSGEIVAANAEDALTALQETDICVVRMEPVPIHKGTLVGRRVILSAQEKSLMLESWDRLLQGGVPMDSVLSHLDATARHPSVKKALREIQRLIREGMPLADAVDASGLLPSSWAAVLEAGERRGDFIGPLKVLQERNEQIRKTIQAVLSALLMPLLLITLIFAWSWIFATWLLPVMADAVVTLTGTGNPVLAGFKSLTAITFPASIAAGAGLIVLGIALARGEQASSVLGAIPACVPVRFPLIGPLVSKIRLIVVASELQLQMEAGIPLLNALVTLSRCLPNRALRLELNEAYREIRSGTPAWQALGNLRIMPASALTLLAAGQASGRLPELLGVVMREASLDLEAQAHRVSIQIRSCAILMAGLILGVLVVSLFGVISCAFDSAAQIAALLENPSPLTSDGTGFPPSLTSRFAAW